MNRVLRRLVDVQPGETAALLWSFAYFFFLLGGYYIVRPLRDEMGIRGGVDQLAWLFTGTFVVMMLVIPIYAVVVAKRDRTTIASIVHGFFAANLLAFWLLLRFEVAPVWTARAFFIWVSVFNMFVVSVFWSVMADTFDREQAKRLFGFVAAGGTAGAIVGPLAAAALAFRLGPDNLLVLAASLLAVASRCVRRIPALRSGADVHAPIGGDLMDGLTRVFRSKYLLSICAYVLLLTTTATFAYFEQQHLVAAAIEGSAERTRLFAGIDLAVNVLTLILQAAFTGRILRWLGVTVVLLSLPVATATGFVVLAIMPTVTTAATLQAVRRAANFALTHPTREILFTIVDREDRYKAKSVVDNLVYRGGDALAGWLFAAMFAGGLSLAIIALTGAAIAMLWTGSGWLLGRSHERLARAASNTNRSAAHA